MRKFLAILLLFAGVESFAQQSLSGIKIQLDAMFAGLDKTKVPSGYLWDTAVNIVEGSGYNGTELTDSNYVTLPLMGDMLRSINSASVGADTICVHAALSRIERNSTTTAQMVGFLFKQYNFIVANALTNNLINYSNGLVSDSYIDGVWQNPYGQDVLFGYAMGNDSVVDQSVTFTITNIDSLSTQSFQSIQFDPGDGQGFRSISIGGTISIMYSSAGYYETKLKVVHNNQTYISHCLISVREPLTAPASTSEAIDTHAVAANGYKAMITYKSPACFDNPLIVVDGFDPWKLFKHNDESPHSYSGYTDINDVLDSPDLAQFISNRNVFFVDWYDCGADIRDNAEVLKEAIGWINAHKTSGNPNIVIGQSMGGLITRYALRDMEINNQLHDTRLFISHDTPFRGANVSPGLLFAYWDLHDSLEDIISLYYALPGEKEDVLNELLHIGHFDSVKQMLKYYVDSNGTYNSNAYNSLQSSLLSMGYPKGDPGLPIENVAIINGGVYSVGSQTYYSFGDELFYFDIHASTGILPEVLLSLLSKHSLKTGGRFIWLPGKTSVDFHFHVYPWLSLGQEVCTVKLSFTKNFFWLKKRTFVLLDKKHYAPSTGVCLDKVPGSYYALARFLPLPLPDNGSNYWWGSYMYNSGVVDSLMFVPTPSALDMNIAEEGYSRNYYDNPPAPMESTPFDGFIIKNVASMHSSYYNGIENWLNLILESSVVGPDIVFSGDCFNVMRAGSPVSYIKWFSRNNQVATIDSLTSVITVCKSGMMDVVARYEHFGRVFTKKKTVLAGIPDMVISQSGSGSTFSAWAEIVSDSVRAFAQTHGLDTLLTYNWYVDKWNTAMDHVVENLPQHTDSVSFTLGTSYTYANIGLNVVHGTDTLHIGPVSVRNADQFHINLYSISYVNNQASFLYYPFGEIPLSMSEGNSLIIIKPNTNASPVGFTDIIPAYATVAGQTFPVVPHFFSPGYYVIEPFSTYEGDSAEHAMAVFNVLRRIQHDDAIILRIYNSYDELLQTKAYVIGRFFLGT